MRQSLGLKTLLICTYTKLSFSGYSIKQQGLSCKKWSHEENSYFLMFMKLKKSEKSLQKPPFVSFIRSIVTVFVCRQVVTGKIKYLANMLYPVPVYCTFLSASRPGKSSRSLQPSERYYFLFWGDIAFFCIRIWIRIRRTIDPDPDPQHSGINSQKGDKRCE
jgi:hypothetical protein